MYCITNDSNFLTSIVRGAEDRRGGGTAALVVECPHAHADVGGRAQSWDALLQVCCPHLQCWGCVTSKHKFTSFTTLLTNSKIYNYITKHLLPNIRNKLLLKSKKVANCWECSYMHFFSVTSYKLSAIVYILTAFRATVVSGRSHRNGIFLDWRKRV